MTLNVISNYAANVAHRYLQQSDTDASQSLAKLSSGQRVVTARDDAAGLAIGSRLVAQLAALQQCSTNATQASSMLQVADGALSKIGGIMDRMKTLAVQASSGQLGSTERGMINTEYQGLLSEIDRISNDTTFNGVTLLAGTPSSVTALNSEATNYIDAAHGIENIAFDSSVTDTTNLGAFFTLSYDSASNVLTAKNLRTGVSQGVSIGSSPIATNTTQIINFGTLGTSITLDSAFSKTTSFLSTGVNSGGSVVAGSGAIVGSSVSITSASAGKNTSNVLDTALTTLGVNSGTIDSTTNNAVKITIGTFTGTADLSSTGTKTMTLSNGGSGTGDSFTVQFVVSQAFVSNATNTGTITIGDLGTIVEATNTTVSTAVSYRIGPGNTSNDNITVTLPQITASALGLFGGDVTNVVNADTASVNIDAAIDKLNTARSGVGAAQNRLQFAADNLSTTVENVDAARSSLLDLDIASEMTVFTSKQVLEQTGIAMLAQANQLPQHLLRLFQ